MTQDTSTEAVATEFFVVTSKSGMHIGLWSDEDVAQSVMREDNGYMIGRVVCGSAYDALIAERVTLAKQAEDCAEKYSKLADKYHEKIDEIIELRQQLAEAKGKENAFRMALRQVFAWASEARPAGYENAILKIEEISESALKSESAPRPKSKAVPLTAAVEVCGICDIAGCHHTRELNEKMPNEIAAWPTFPDGCVTGSWSANQHHQDAVAYVRKEPAPGHLDDECQRCGSVGGFGCYECTPAPHQIERVSLADLEGYGTNSAPRQSVQEAAKVLLDVWEREGLEAMGARLRALAQEAQGDE